MSKNNLLQPTACVESFEHLPVEKLKVLGVRGVALDLDGSLTGHDSEVVPDAHLAKIEEIYSAGMEAVISSNANSEGRVDRVKRFLGHITKEVGIKELKAITSLEVGFRKPNRAMFIAAAKSLGLTPEQMCHFGDQIPKDIFGANRAGYAASILCKPWGKGGNAATKYLQRPAEALVRPFLKLPFHTANFKDLVWLDGK